jgi:hypothetical protein
MRDTGDAQLDFLVPAQLASRYHARITEVSAEEARLRMPFLPSMFRKGVMSCCPAQLTIAEDERATCVRGVFEPDANDASTDAHFRFLQPISPRELEILRCRCTVGAS